MQGVEKKKSFFVFAYSWGAAWDLINTLLIIILLCDRVGWGLFNLNLIEMQIAAG